MTAAPFSSFVDDYFDVLFRWDPTAATRAGFHEPDREFPDLSRSAHLARIEKLHELDERLESHRQGTLSPDDGIDAEIIAAAIAAEHFDLETLGNWRRNPIEYFWLFGRAIDSLIQRDFAPAAERLTAVTARLRGIPPAVEAMKTNLENPPRQFTELAMRVASGSVGFFGETIDQWAREAAAGNRALLADFDAAHRPAAAAIEDAASWLEAELLPRSTGAYAIGTEAFTAKLRYEEMTDVPLAELLAVGEANLERDYRDFVATAYRIDANRTPAEVMRSVSDDYPRADSLLAATEETLGGVLEFLESRPIVTLPSRIRPFVTETPPYFRFGVFAAMNTPGPYETRAREAYYYVTPPEPGWHPEHREQHLRLFNRPVLEIITIHEAYPGHYVQFLNAPRFPTKTRRLLSATSNTEGWAHYTEQMMIEAGYGGGAPRIRLAQLQEALIRDCRLVAGIRLHTGRMSIDEAVRLFAEKAFMEPANAMEETLRGTFDPTYGVYTIGKLQIYKLRDDWMRQTGSSDLRGFHDAFLLAGRAPMRLTRRLMLGADDDSPTLPGLE